MELVHVFLILLVHLFYSTLMYLNPFLFVASTGIPKNLNDLTTASDDQDDVSTPGAATPACKIQTPHNEQNECPVFNCFAFFKHREDLHYKELVTKVIL